LITDEFARMPDPADGSRQELVRGVIETMPPPSFYHGRCCSRIDRKLGIFIDENQLGYLTGNDSGVILEHDPDTVRGPDIAFWSRDRLPDPPQQGYPSVARILWSKSFRRTMSSRES
jgi:Uma2 family endonuclease